MSGMEGYIELVGTFGMLTKSDEDVVVKYVDLEEALVGRSGDYLHRMFLTETSPLPAKPWAIVTDVTATMFTGSDGTGDIWGYLVELDIPNPTDYFLWEDLWDDLDPDDGRCSPDDFYLDLDQTWVFDDFQLCVQSRLWEDNAADRKFSLGISTRDPVSNAYVIFTTNLGMTYYYDDPDPTKPLNLSYTVVSSHPKLNWDPPNNGNKPHVDIDYYKIYIDYYTDSGHSSRTVTTTNTYWTDTQFFTGGFYNLDRDDVHYKVTAFDEYKTGEPSGGNESPFSNQIVVKGSGPEWKILAPDLVNIPTTFSLQGNHPNPFNPKTTIQYGLPEESIVVLKIYDLMGREIKTIVIGTENPGFKNVMWDSKDNNGRPVPSGMYFYRIDAVSKESDDEFHETKKMVLLK